MSKLEDNLKEKVTQINEDRARKEKVSEWVDGLSGKIIGFKSPEESYHIVFTREGALLRKGDYPSCEVSYRGSVEDILKILRGEERAASIWKAGEFKVWGSLSEAVRFEAIL